MKMWDLIIVLSVLFVNCWVSQIATSMFTAYAHVEGKPFDGSSIIRSRGHIFFQKQKSPEKSMYYSYVLTYTHLTINSVVLIKVREFQVNIKIS